MKKFFQSFVPLMALLLLVVLVATLSSCGKLTNYTYKNDNNSSMTLHFGKTECEVTEKLPDGSSVTLLKTTYKVKGKEIVDDVIGITLFEILDSKKTKLKDENWGTWTKI